MFVWYFVKFVDVVYVLISENYGICFECLCFGFWIMYYGCCEIGGRDGSIVYVNWSRREIWYGFEYLVFFEIWIVDDEVV